MTLWVILAVMTVAAAALLLWPLMRKYGQSARRSSYEAAIYQEQLKSLQSEVDQGMLGTDEARSARSEIGRRLLAATDEKTKNAPPDDSRAGRRAAAIMVMLFVPVVSFGLYAVYGTPDLPGVPAAARLAAEEKNPSIEMLIARVEEHLATNPGDARGWQVLAPALMRLRRYEAAAAAFRRIIELNGPTAETLSILGEALMFDNGGIIDARSNAAFAEAAALDPALPDPRFFLGLASLQNQDKDGAVAIWRKMLDDGPADAPWRGEIKSQIARALGVPPQSTPGPGAEDVAAAEEMSAQDRNKMISTMVAGLDSRLRQDGGTVEEWLRLAKAYQVMDQSEKRDEVITRAREALAGDPDALSRFEAGIDPSNKG